jgi:hypothetical protein
MQTTPVGPLSFGEILDRAFALYRHNFAPLFLAALVPFIPIAIFWIVVAMVLPATEEGMRTATLMEMLILPYTFVATLLVWGALARLAARAQSGEGIAWSAEYRETFRRFPRLLAVMLLTMLTVTLGLVLLIIPGILAMIMLFAVIPVVMLEDRGPLEAMRRSRELASNAWGRILAVLLVVMIITAIPSFAVGAASVVGAMYDLAQSDGAATVGVGLAVNQVLATLVSALVAPLFSLVLVTLYFDRRVRLEGLDLEMDEEQLPSHA